MSKNLFANKIGPENFFGIKIVHLSFKIDRLSFKIVSENLASFKIALEKLFGERSIT